MNCPSCQKELPGNSLATLCPFCRAELPTPAFQPIWISWPKFFAILLAPALGTFLAIVLNSGVTAVLFGLVGTLVAGLICAQMLMQGVTLVGFKRVLTHFSLALLLCGLTFFLCFLGCTGALSLPNHSL